MDFDVVEYIKFNDVISEITVQLLEYTICRVWSSILEEYLQLSENVKILFPFPTT